MYCVRRCFGGLWNQSWLKATFFQYFRLRRVCFFRDFVSIIEIFCIQNSFCGFSKVIPEKCFLLHSVSEAHMSSLVDIRRSSAIKSAIVLVHLILWRSLTAIETSSISPEVRVGSHSGGDTEIVSCLCSALSSIFNCAGLVYVNVINVVECLVSLCELSSVRRRATCDILAVLNRLGPRVSLAWNALLSIKRCVVLRKLLSARWRGSLVWLGFLGCETLVRSKNRVKSLFFPLWMKDKVG